MPLPEVGVIKVAQGQNVPGSLRITEIGIVVVLAFDQGNALQSRDDILEMIQKYHRLGDGAGYRNDISGMDEGLGVRQCLLLTCILCLRCHKETSNNLG